MSPLNSYFEMRKSASFGRGFTQAAFNPTTLGAAAGVGLLTSGMSMIGPAAIKIRNAITKKRDFEQMMHLNPDLVQFRAAVGPELFAQQYTSLRNVSPQSARDPLIAGTFMRNMADAPTNAGNSLLLAGKGEADMGKGRSSPEWISAATRQFGHVQSDDEAEMSQGRLQQMRDKPADNKLQAYEKSRPSVIHGRLGPKSPARLRGQDYPLMSSAPRTAGHPGSYPLGASFDPSSGVTEPHSTFTEPERIRARR